MKERHLIHHRKKGRIDGSLILQTAQHPTAAYRSDACPVATDKSRLAYHWKYTTVLEEKLQGKRSRGRRQQGYTDGLKHWTKRHEEMKRMAEESSEKRPIVAIAGPAPAGEASMNLGSDYLLVKTCPVTTYGHRVKIMDLESPKELEILGNLSENWKRFKQRFEIFLEASGLNEKTDRTKTAIFLNIAGENAIDIYDNFKFEKEEDKYNLDIILKNFRTIAIH
ncbi:hypothetical protein LAZ67_18001683 [Cordylochernes scorpioides]|uniref:Uncharacterized protein n=1 Tax=Cordylochernes scorpioides TaxID=51811 RepID=A0ABY6LFZ1_9ARAC|nr:hypothetical protein LAZ67_18001683 [Cordylochernes scorpioides]